MNERSSERASGKEEAPAAHRIPWGRRVWRRRVVWFLKAVLGLVYLLISIHVLANRDVALAISTKALGVPQK